MDSIIFEDKTVFLTGSSGFLGTALASKIILATSCPSLILLCRGGLHRLHKVWQDILPPSVFARLRDDPRIEVLDGDICMRDMGMDQATIRSLRQRVNVVIHAASSINLRHSLSRIAPIIIQGTLSVAEFALSCMTLHRFVYISTAYANAHLHYLNPKEITRVSERVHRLTDESGLSSDAESEWLHLQKYGTTPEFDANSFPWAYAYAKHLTERLLIGMFHATDNSSISQTSVSDDSITFSGQEKLLIVRPSIIGPAETFPTPGWQVASSAPVTGLLAFLILTPAKRLTFYSQFDDPFHQSVIDEVPVDVVANRIIMHTFMGTPGIVHANSKLVDCFTFTEYVQAAHKLRRLPYDSKIKWHSDSASPKICPIAKLYQVSGCTYDFEDSTTQHLWSAMQKRDQHEFPLFAMEKSCSNRIDIASRDEGFRRLFAAYFQRRKWPAWMLPVFYAPSGT